MAQRIGSKHLLRSMKPLSKSRAYAEEGKVKRLARPMAVMHMGKLRLSLEGRDYYLKKLVERTALPVIDAFLPKLPAVERERLLKFLIKGTRGATAQEEANMSKARASAVTISSLFSIVDPDLVQGKMKEIAEQARPRIVFSKFAAESDFLDLTNNGIAAHEILHFIYGQHPMPGMNSYLGVVALGNYFSYLGLAFDAKSMKRVNQQIELAKDKLKPMEPAKVMEFQTEAVRSGKSFSEIAERHYAGAGVLLALKAASIEGELGQPGAGLFFIREVCSGRSLQEAESAMRNDPPAELKDWQERHGKRWEGITYRHALADKIASEQRFRELQRKRLAGLKK
ncbi:MAG: hypothetical protein NT067_06995 [Candidatus Diapherotrites archaeon]|nr:hypothetical protein [Candidatus Diapherotrites archaeon]